MSTTPTPATEPDPPVATREDLSPVLEDLQIFAPEYGWRVVPDPSAHHASLPDPCPTPWIIQSGDELTEVHAIPFSSHFARRMRSVRYVVVRVHGYPGGGHDDPCPDVDETESTPIPREAAQDAIRHAHEMRLHYFVPPGRERRDKAQEIRRLLASPDYRNEDLVDRVHELLDLCERHPDPEPFGTEED